MPLDGEDELMRAAAFVARNTVSGDDRTRLITMMVRSVVGRALMHLSGTTAQVALERETTRILRMMRLRSIL